MSKLRKPNSCPECNGSDIRFVIHGFPSDEGLEKCNRKEAVLGGCVSSDDDKFWRCMVCKHEFNDETDPAFQEMRRKEKELWEFIRSGAYEEMMEAKLAESRNAG